MSSNSLLGRIGLAVLVISAAAACGSSSDEAIGPSPVVTAVTATVRPGPDPSETRFDFTGTVTATGATPVTYRWELSTGELQSVQVMHFGGAGSLSTTYAYVPLKTCIGPSQQLWARLNVLAPNIIESQKVTFTRTCVLL